MTADRPAPERLDEARRTTQLPIAADRLEAVCRRYGVRRLALFGSRARGLGRPDSDVDLLVEFDEDVRPSLLDLAALEFDLSAEMGGIKVDLRTPAELSRYFREQVVLEARTQYVSG